MPKGNDLFELIHALTRSEKRYFRMSSSLHTKGEMNQYVRLFDGIERQQAYDEAELLEWLAEPAIAEHFPEAKYYLYQAILKSLHTYHSENSVDVRIATLIHQSEILYDKKLYEQCAAILARARAMAVQHEKWYLMSDVLFAGHRLLLLETGKLDLGRRFGALMDDIRGYQHLQAEWAEYWGHYAAMFAIERAVGLPRTREELDVYRAYAEGEMIKSDSGPQSPTAQLFHTMTLMLYRSITYDFNGALEAIHTVLAMVRTTPQWSKKAAGGLVPTLQAICGVSLRAGRADQFLEYYPELLRRSVARPHSDRFKAYIVTLTLRVKLFADAGYFDIAMARMREIESLLGNTRLRHRTGDRAVLAMYCFNVAFGAGEHRASLDYLNSVLADRSAREYIQAIARVLALIVHFEMRNYDVLENQLKSTYKYLHAKGKLFGFERAILEFIRKAMDVPAEAQLQPLYRELLAKLTPMAADPFERVPIDMFNSIAWVKSKIERRPFAEIVREQFRAQSGDIFALAEQAGVTDILLAPVDNNEWQNAA